ncbi:hypothetical protein CCM_03065 [Cordyceps militaris CM01]|uniref:Uncharacterized protein n=1 Tax=Cordyceps militaris (strain CM01) TaxID=983644 RepID=G3J8K7_CORMM|nr:uncharacterized protein CCM_03065 [Cordyceps militaris CM01]EGX94794.1 hypothetical protein CCM_03065 [Cordyceps militaris CM01]
MEPAEHCYARHGASLDEPPPPASPRRDSRCKAPNIQATTPSTSTRRRRNPAFRFLMHAAATVDIGLGREQKMNKLPPSPLAVLILYGRCSTAGHPPTHRHRAWCHHQRQGGWTFGSRPIEKRQRKNAPKLNRAEIHATANEKLHWLQEPISELSSTGASQHPKP